MVYTPTDQLPPPPKFMLDEVEAAEKAHLDDLLAKCSTIRTFRKHVLPIYYRHKSATGHIMAEAIETWREGQQKYSDWRMANYGQNYGHDDLYAPPWERVDNPAVPAVVRYNSYFHKSYFEDINDWECLEDGVLRPICYKSPSSKMRDYAIRFIQRQIEKFVAYKNGRVPESRIRYAKEIFEFWKPIAPSPRFTTNRLRNLLNGQLVHDVYSPRPFKYRKFWEIMDDWKKLKFKRLQNNGFLQGQNEINELILVSPELSY
tara:strand:+ start:1076 stop:1855 length:780 start_codon:yes stop_codon:yes gene_type:complete